MTYKVLHRPLPHKQTYGNALSLVTKNQTMFTSRASHV